MPMYSTDKEYYFLTSDIGQQNKEHWLLSHDIFEN